MFFSSLALLASALTITSYNGQNNCTLTKVGDLYGGNVERYHIDQRVMLDPREEDTVVAFACDVTGTETRQTGVNDFETETLTYHNFFKITYRYYDDEDYFSWGILSSYGENVAPSLFIEVTILEYDWNEYLGVQGTYYCDTISSYGDSDLEYFELQEAPSIDYVMSVDLYLVHTIASDPMSSDTSDYQSGYDEGYNVGYENGHNDGTLDGYQDAYDDGYAHGHRDGYNYGYVTGLNTTTYTFKDLFASVSDTPILMLRRLFGFELFGTSLMTVFVSLITALIVLMILKKFIKR